MTQRTSAAGRARLRAREGCRLQAYRDAVGVPTIGVGHTGRTAPPVVHLGMSITEAEADAFLAADLAPVEAAVADAIARPLGQNQFDACVSLAFNIGVRGFQGSTVVHRLSAGDVAGAADAFLMWDRPPALRARREAERAQFLAPDAPRSCATPAPPIVPPASAGPHLLPKSAPGFWARLLDALRNKAA